MKTRFFRVAVEGATTDGRVIDRDWLIQMAQDYDPVTYGARVNMEHIRGFSPDKPFNAYGDVLALETRDVELRIAGKTETKLGLFAQLEANDQLVANLKAGQKVYTSIEVNPNFAGKGRAYLMGLAVTDSPASLGTEMIAFAAQAKVNPLAARKQHQDNLFTATDEAVEIELAEATDKASTPAFSIDAFMDAAARKFGLKAEEPKARVESEPAPADPTAALMSAVGQALTDGFKAFGDQLAAERTKDRDAFTQLQADVNALKTDIEATPHAKHTARPTSDGGGFELAQF